MRHPMTKSHNKETQLGPSQVSGIIKNLITALKIRSVYQLKLLNEKLQSSKATKDEKTNDLYALDIDKASKLHIEYIIVD